MLLLHALSFTPPHSLLPALSSSRLLNLLLPHALSRFNFLHALSTLPLPTPFLNTIFTCSFLTPSLHSLSPRLPYTPSPLAPSPHPLYPPSPHALPTHLHLLLPHALSTLPLPMPSLHTFSTCSFLTPSIRSLSARVLSRTVPCPHPLLLHV